MQIRKRKSRAQVVADALAGYLKLKAAGKAAKGAKKAAKGTAAYKVAKKTPIVKRIPLVAGAGAGIAAAFVAVRKLKGGGGEPAAA
jgi:hypothetical protein